MSESTLDGKLRCLRTLLHQIGAQVGAETVGDAIGMLNAYADLREQIERTREGVTDEVVLIACRAAWHWPEVVETADRQGKLDQMRDAIQSVAHLLPSGERGGVDGEFAECPICRGWSRRPPAQVAQVDGDAPCAKCGSVSVDTGFECNDCGHDNAPTAAPVEPIHWCDSPAGKKLERDIAAAQPASPEQPAKHADDVAVDRFAEAMKEKLAAARMKGRGGWQDKTDCPQQRLSDMLRAHLEKGDPRDVANFCMFLHQRGEAILPRGRSMMELASDPSLRRAPPEQPAGRQEEAVALIAQWRKESPVGSKYDVNYRSALRRCAYELERAMRNTRPAAPVGVPDGWRETILAVLGALDKATGDSDPNIDPDMTDEEVRDEYPEVWVMQKLTGLLAAAPSAPPEQKACTRNCDCVGPCKMGVE